MHSFKFFLCSFNKFTYLFRARQQFLHFFRLDVAVCSYSHRRLDIPECPLYFCPIHLLADQQTDRCIIFRHLKQFIHRTHIEIQLTRKLRFKRLYLQFHHKITPETDMVKQQINFPCFSCNHYLFLTTYERKPCTEFQ